MSYKDKKKQKAYLKKYEKTRKPRDRKAYQKTYRDSHNVERKAYILVNADNLKNYQKKYQRPHPEKRKAYCKAYDKAYQLANAEKIKSRQKAYHLAHPEKRKIRRRKQRALRRNVYHEPYTGNYIFERDGWVCQICGQKINKRLKYPNPRAGSIDHIVPLSKGGDDSPINVQASHLRCNVGKHATNKGQLRLFG